MDNTLIYKNYIGSVQYSQEDNLFHGKINGINDLITYKGDSIINLKSSFIEAVEDYKDLLKILSNR